MLQGCLTYDAKRFFLQGEAELVMGHYVQILKLIAGSCDAPVSRISFLQEKEHKLVQKCNDTKRAIPPGGVHQLFEKQAKACPDAVALEFTDAPGMTYAEMDARANRLANHLHSMGVGAGSLVGVFLERTPDLPVSLLAVLKVCGLHQYLKVHTSLLEGVFWVTVKDAWAGRLAKAGKITPR